MPLIVSKLIDKKNFSYNIHIYKGTDIDNSLLDAEPKG